MLVYHQVQVIELKEKKNKSKPKSKTPVMIVGLMVGISLLGVIVYAEITKDDPVQVMIYYQFENGTKKWTYMDSNVPVHTQSGTIWITVEEAFLQRNMTSYQTKTIHLNSGIIDYNFVYEDSIGGTSSGKTKK